jgi:enoyl-CoA hydratase/carnithine racemase
VSFVHAPSLADFITTIVGFEVFGTHTEHVKTEIADGVLTITLRRPEKKNALTGAMYNALSDALKKAEVDPSVRVILFQGDGDSFTAGNDLADFASQARGESAVDSPAQHFIETISKAGKPIVAAVQGNAVGVGTTMLLHCDLAYVADNAKLIAPFVNLALVPEAASSWLLPLRIGHARAHAMFALGEPMEASAAVACGVANAVLPQAELRKKAHDAAITLTKRPAGALKLTKKLMRDHERIAVQISEESQLFKERLKTPEAREAFAAFAERRPPDFSKVA